MDCANSLRGARVLRNEPSRLPHSPLGGGAANQLFERMPFSLVFPRKTKENGILSFFYFSAEGGA
jgi:hypothetical protein